MNRPNEEAQVYVITMFNYSENVNSQKICNYSVKLTSDMDTAIIRSYLKRQIQGDTFIHGHANKALQKLLKLKFL